MGRETLLTLLIVLFGGLVMQPLALLPWRLRPDATPRLAERRAWAQLWAPVVPMLLVGAWLCGWALREPDPVRTRFDHGMIIGASLPFAVLALRAVLRAAWALVREPAHLPVCTVGLWRPRVVVDPLFARQLDEGPLRAALEHECAHARHRDPLRIWLGQLAADLQWPWPRAHRRFQAWLEWLEHARDDEARGHGASATDLAAAVVATARRLPPMRAVTRGARLLPGEAALLGDPRLLASRIERLLQPLPEGCGLSGPSGWSDAAALIVLGLVLCAALALGAAYGNDFLHPFLLWTRSA